MMSVNERSEYAIGEVAEKRAGTILGSLSDNTELIVDLITKSNNVAEVDSILSESFPHYKDKEKFEFLDRHFKCHIVACSDGTDDFYKYYKLVIQYILGSVQDFGSEAVKK